MSFDDHKNLAVSTVAVAPSPATSGASIDVAAGHGARFPAPPFNCTMWPAGVSPDPSNAEIVRVTAIVGDTLTIVRAQESSTAQAVFGGFQLAATITAKTLTDIEGSWLGLPVTTPLGDARLQIVDLSTALTTTTATPGSYPAALLNWLDYAGTTIQPLDITVPASGDYTMDFQFDFGATSLPSIGVGNSCRLEIERYFGLFGGIFGPAAPPVISWSALNNSFESGVQRVVFYAEPTRDTYHSSAPSLVSLGGMPLVVGDVYTVAVATRIVSISGTIPAGYSASTSAPSGKFAITRTS